MSGFIKYFENGGKNMSFLIKDDEVLEKCEQIWNVIKNKLQSVTKYLGLTLVFMWNVHRGKGLLAIFRDFSASINKIFILTGRETGH